MTATTDEAIPPAPTIPEVFSRTFRSGVTRSRVAIASLVIVAIAVGALAWTEVAGLALIDRAELGQVSDLELLEYDRLVQAIAGAYLLALIVCAIAFLAWLSRTIDNIPVLTGRIPSTTPRWSIGWWFVPIANFLKPYQVVKEASVHLAGPSGRPSSGLILVWWIAFIVGSIASNVVSRLPVFTVDDYRTFLTAGLVVDLLEVGAALLAIVVVLRIQSSADASAASASASPPDLSGAPPPTSSPVESVASVPPVSPHVAASNAEAATAGPGHCPRCGSARVPGLQNCATCGVDLWALWDEEHRK
jgi:hypothetical protein